MAFNNENILNDRDKHLNQVNDSKPTASRVDDDDNLTENELERTLFNENKNTKPVREGQPMGGENFGQNNLTSAANDKNNPSQYAGNTNAYFDRTEPSEEHPEDSNFTAIEQDGEPDYDKAQPSSEFPKPEVPERGNGENDRPHKSEPYQEGTADNDEVNIPGPGEVPDQQKVGEGDDEDYDDKDHIET